MRIEKPRSPSGQGMRRCLWWCLAFVAVGAPGVFANDCQLQLDDGSDVTQSHWDVYLDLQQHVEWHYLKDTTIAGWTYYTFTNARNVLNVSTISKYFETTYDDDLKEVIIKTGDKFPNYKEDNSSLQEVALALQFKCKGGSKKLDVYFSIEDSNMYPPIMKSLTYEYTPAMPLAKGYILTSIQPIEGNDFDFTTTDIQANISCDFDLFSAQTVPFSTDQDNVSDWRTSFQVKITAKKEVRLKEKLVCPLTILDNGTSSDSSQATTKLSVVIDPDLKNTVFNPRFEDPLYTVDVQDLTAEEISPNLPLVDFIGFEEGFSEDLVYTLEDGGSHDGGNAKDFIKLDSASNGVRLLWRDDLDPVQLEKFLKKSFALLVLTAEIPDSLFTPSARTVIHVALPGSKIEFPATSTTAECPITCPPVTECPTEGTAISECPTQCPTCPTEFPATSTTTECPLTCQPVTECPAGPSTCGPSVSTEPGVTSDPGKVLEFEKSSYFKTIAANEEAGSSIAVIKLKDDLDGVAYSLEAESQSSPLGALDIDGGGSVTLVFPPPLGTHSYFIHAVVPEVGKGRTQLWLYVSNIPDENGNFPYALEVRKVPENKKTQVWPGSGNNEKQCVTITGGEKYFALEDNIVYSRNTIDRESEEFNGVESPVVSLKIHSSCAQDGKLYTNHSLRATWDEAVGNIVYDQNYTTVAVIIEDENDNPPRFDPSAVVIGYPERELAAALRLSSLLVAEAKDLDVGDNAKLRYSLDERGAKQLEVHPQSGAVYPRNDVTAVQDGFIFTVSATDRDGSPGDEGTLTGDLDVTVRALHPEHLLEVRVRGALLEDVGHLLALASGSGASSRQLHALSSVVLSGDGDANEGEDSDEEDGETRVARNATLRRRRFARSSAEEETDVKSYLRVVVYSIADGKPEKAEEFETDVKKTLAEGGWPPETASPDLERETIWSKSNNSGLLAAVITLGVLLGLMLIGTGLAGYWFAIRPRIRKSGLPPHYDHKSAKLSDPVVEIEPITDDFLKTRNLENELREEATPEVDIPTEIDFPRPMIIFNDELVRGTDVKDVMLDDAVSEAGTLDTINTYDTILSGEQRALPKKSVVFNEDVDCIEIRL